MATDPDILKQYILESGIQYRQTAISYVFHCPRCGGKNKLYIRKNDGRFCCWVCKNTESYQGRAEYALADLLGQSIATVRSRLYGDADVPVSFYLDSRLVDFFGDEDVEEVVDTEVPIINWPFDYYPIDYPGAAKAVAYLESRGIPLEIAKQYDIHYSPLKRRVVFPISSGGSLYGYQERLIIPNTWVDEAGKTREMPKILSSSGIPRERVVMFSDRLQGSEHVVLCEGPVDAIKAHLCGGNVATMGKAVSTGQMKLILNSGIKKVYLALDPDAADEVSQLVRTYYDEVELYQMLATGDSDKPDLGAMSFAEVKGLFDGAERIGAGRLFFYLKPPRTTTFSI